MSRHEYSATQMTVVNPVTFMPGECEHQHHAIFSIANGQTPNDLIPIHVWGKRAVVAAHYLYKGKGINVKGILKTYMQDVGDRKQLRIEVHATCMEFLSDSLQADMLSMTETLADFFETTPKEDLENPDVIELAHDITSKSRRPIELEEWDEEKSNKTAKFGHPSTRIWSRDKGFWEPEPCEVGINVDDDGEVQVFIG